MSVRNTVVFTTASSPLPSPSSSERDVPQRLGHLRRDATVHERAVQQAELAGADQPRAGADDRCVGSDRLRHGREGVQVS